MLKCHSTALFTEFNCAVRCLPSPPPFCYNHTHELWNHNGGDEEPQSEHMIGRGNLSVKHLAQSDAEAPAVVDTEQMRGFNAGTEEAKRMSGTELTVSLEPGDEWKWTENVSGVTVTMTLAYTPPRCTLLAVSPATALVYNEQVLSYKVVSFFGCRLSAVGGGETVNLPPPRLSSLVIARSKGLAVEGSNLNRHRVRMFVPIALFRRLVLSA